MNQSAVKVATRWQPETLPVLSRAAVWDGVWDDIDARL
jgi:hypothetical protein